jgi:hypothetical protein
MRATKLLVAFVVVQGSFVLSFRSFRTLSLDTGERNGRLDISFVQSSSFSYSCK